MLVSHGKARPTGGPSLATCLLDDTFLQQTGFLGGHYKVVRLVFIIDNVLQLDAKSLR